MGLNKHREKIIDLTKENKIMHRNYNLLKDEFVDLTKENKTMHRKYNLLKDECSEKVEQLTQENKSLITMINNIKQLNAENERLFDVKEYNHLLEINHLLHEKQEMNEKFNDVKQCKDKLAKQYIKLTLKSLDQKKSIDSGIVERDKYKKRKKRYKKKWKILKKQNNASIRHRSDIFDDFTQEIHIGARHWMLWNQRLKI